MHVRKNDQVMVITGKDAGKIGKVLATAGGERLKHEETGFKEIAIFKTGVTL